MEISGLYNQFFEKDKKNTPYECQEEYLKDLFRFLDVSLNIACARKYIDPDNGSPILDIENKHLFSMPFTLEYLVSALRLYEIDNEDRIQNSMVYNVLYNCGKHIEYRTINTDMNYKDYPIKYISDMFCHSDFERFIFLLSIATYYDSKYETIFAYLQDDVRVILPTKRLAVALFSMFSTVENFEINNIIQNKGIMFEELFILRNMSDRAVVAYDQSFVSRNIVYSFCKGYYDLDTSLKEFAYLYIHNDENIEDNILIRDEYIDKISNLFGYNIKSHGIGNLIHIYGQNGLGKHFIVKQAGNKNKKNIIFVDISEIIYKSVDDVIAIINMIYLETILLDAVSCFYINEMFEEASDENTLITIPKSLDLTLRTINSKFGFAIWLSEEKGEYLKKYKFHFMNMELPILSVNERIILWEKCSKKYVFDEEIDFTLCSNQFVLSISGIKEVLRTADFIRISNNKNGITKQDILIAVKQQAANQLGRKLFCKWWISLLYFTCCSK